MANGGHLSQILLFGCLLSAVLETHSAGLEFQSCHHEFNEQIFKNVSIQLIGDGKRKVFNGTVITAIDMHQFKLHATNEVVQKNGRKFTFFNVTLDGCEFVEQSTSVSMNLSYLILRDIRNVLKNVPRKCPLKKDTEISVDMLYIDSSNWPLYLPESRFLFVLIFKHNDVIGFKLSVNGVVVPRRKRIG